MVVIQKQIYQTIEHVHYYHHDKHSLPLVGLLFIVFFDEWLRTLLGFSTQPVLLHFDVVH
jgi:hypothetical protein